MQKKFFIRRFYRYFLLLIIPTFLAFVVSFMVANQQINDNLDSRAKNTLSNVNVNLNMVLSSVVQQNDQLTNNGYMLVSLKKLMRQDKYLSFSDSIFLRNIKAMLNSILQSYPYVNSVYLYLDGYDRYFSSNGGVIDLEKDSAPVWLLNYQDMLPEEENKVTSELSDHGRQELGIYQRMLLEDGVVVMNIDVGRYRAVLNSILSEDDGIILFVSEQDELLFSWNDDGEASAFQIQNFDVEDEQNTWQSVGEERYLIHTAYNEKYNIHLVSLLPSEERTKGFFEVLRIFVMIFAVNSAMMLLLAYATTKRSFHQLNYMIQVFHDAEQGNYPAMPKREVKDEYDVIMNNIIYLHLKTVELNNHLMQKEHEQEVAELMALQLQINPHFLFNTLQTVQLEMQKEQVDKQKLKKVLDDLSDILKYALGDPMEPITIREEIAYLKRYVSIQKFRFGDKFILYYDMDEELECFRVFRLMLQPLVENSILHGVRHKKERGYIKVQIFRRRGRVHFRVVDNGVGMSKEDCGKLREKIKERGISHIGLSNVNSRLTLRFGEEAGIQIRSKLGVGTVMEFSLPESSVM